MIFSVAQIVNYYWDHERGESFCGVCSKKIQ